MGKAAVLFVDDDERVLNSWRRHFSDERYTIVMAKSGDDARRIMAGIKVAVVVTDYSMPRGDGLELLRYVSTEFPDTARILVSGQATLKIASEALNACGVFRIFEKPCSPIDLAIAIREALSLSGEQRPLEEASLEREFPGITRLKRGPGGAIMI